MSNIDDFKKYIYKIEDNNINLEIYLSDINFNDLKQKYAYNVYYFNKQFKIVNTIKDIINNIINLHNNLIINNINLVQNEINAISNKLETNTIIKNESLKRDLYPDNIYIDIKEMYNSDNFTEIWNSPYNNKQLLIENLDNIKKILNSEELKLNKIAFTLNKTIFNYIKVKTMRELLSSFTLKL